MWTQRFLPVLLVLSGLGLCGCRSAQTFDVPYSQVEARLLGRLKVAPEDLGSGSRYVAMEADPTLSRCLTVALDSAPKSRHCKRQSIGFHFQTTGSQPESLDYGPESTGF